MFLIAHMPDIKGKQHLRLQSCHNVGSFYPLATAVSSCPSMIEGGLPRSSSQRGTHPPSGSTNLEASVRCREQGVSGESEIQEPGWSQSSCFPQSQDMRQEPFKRFEAFPESEALIA